jgi:BNR repeat-like domain
MQAGLAGTSETDIVSGFCERCVAAGFPLARTTVLIDTLHPVLEGRLFRWGFGPTESPLLEKRVPNPNSGIDAIKLRDGRAMLVFNDTASGRSPLNIGVSRDGCREGFNAEEMAELRWADPT